MGLILQDVLIVGIGKYVLRIDSAKVSMGEGFSAEAPLQCSVDGLIDGLIDGVQLVGRHDGEVTDLSMCQSTTTRLVSASTDGLVCSSMSYYLVSSCNGSSTNLFIVLSFSGC